MSKKANPFKVGDVVVAIAGKGKRSPLIDHIREQYTKQFPEHSKPPEGSTILAGLRGGTPVIAVSDGQLTLEFKTGINTFRCRVSARMFERKPVK
jgi:hypothetical protein